MSFCWNEASLIQTDSVNHSQLTHRVIFRLRVTQTVACVVSKALTVLFLRLRCGNVAAILELDEHLQKEFIIFEAAPQETRGIPSKKPVADYFLWATGSAALCVLLFLFLS